jgi:CheY-like chemotaxis protein
MLWAVSGEIPGETPSGPRARPRLLLVDDHPEILDVVATMLAQDYDIVGTAGSGRQALDLAPRLRPDLIVLDVSMSDYDGFQTFDGLQQLGLRVPVVFLSMHEELDFVDAAFRRGGLGYVVKSRLARDLPRAVDQALLGRRFAPSLPALFALGESGHAMHVHSAFGPFLDGAAAFLSLALGCGNAVCVIATAPVRSGVEQRLRARGWDVANHGRYRAFNAADALKRIMHGVTPDPDRVAEVVEELDQFRLARAEGLSPRLTIVGDMIGRLHVTGNVPAAIAVEQAWDSVTRGRPFLTLCAHADSFFRRTAPEVWSDTCAAHGALSQSREV